MKPQTNHTFSRIVLLLSVLFVSSAYHPSMAQAGCSIINKLHPAQFIEYAGASESFSQVKLRLQNNTNCTIIVETDDRAPSRLVKLPNGGVKLETVMGSEDGVRLALHYLVHDRRRQTVKTGYGWGDSVFAYEIPAGQSVVFNVPSAALGRRLDIAVPFNYSWEGENVGMGAGGTVHRVYFLFDDLPKDMLRRRGLTRG